MCDLGEYNIEKNSVKLITVEPLILDALNLAFSSTELFWRPSF